MYDGKNVRIIAAIAQNGVIGSAGRLPWKPVEYPGEMDHFRTRTKRSGANTVVMGRRTWDSIPEHNRPLSERSNIVLTSNPSFNERGVRTASSLEEALEEAPSDVWLIGGEQLYAEALSKGYVDALVLSMLPRSYEGDAYFPPIPSSFVPVDQDDRGRFVIVTYVRDA